MEWIHRVYNKYLHDFSWPTHQRHLNRHAHYLARIPDGPDTITIHFTHTPSPRPDAIPLILIHGWPGSFAEFDRVVDALASPPNPSDPAFHVVVPSLPGFCWSPPPPRRGWTMQDSARVLHSLMLTLGYARYAAQAGDWGSFVAREMGAKYATWCRAVHFNFCPVKVAEGQDDPAARSEREKFIDARAQSWLDDHLAYAVAMRTRPHTIGVALVDNPVGIMMWVGEKYLEAATEAHAREPEWDEALLVQASLYYFSGCIMTSMLPYYEGIKHAEFGAFFLREENYVRCPMGYTSYKWDTRPSYEKAVRPTGNLVYYNGMFFFSLVWSCGKGRRVGGCANGCVTFRVR